MTTEDADQLEAWVTGLTNEQLRLLWRWVTLYTMARLGRAAWARQGRRLTAAWEGR
jgi:hypothetical protein